MCYVLYCEKERATMRSTMREHPLKEYRKAKEMTQGELASVLGVSDAMITHVENGRRRVTPEKAREWEKKIGVPKEALCPEIFGEAA